MSKQRSIKLTLEGKSSRFLTSRDVKVTDQDGNELNANLKDIKILIPADGPVICVLEMYMMEGRLQLEGMRPEFILDEHTLEQMARARGFTLTPVESELDLDEEVGAGAGEGIEDNDPRIDIC